MTLNRTVQPAASIIVSLPGSFSSKTRTTKTIVASPRGPNQPMKSLSVVLVRVPIRQRLAHVLGAAQQFFLVALTQPAQQQPADKARDEPAAARRLRPRKARRRQRDDRNFHPVFANPAAPFGKSSIKALSQVSASPTINPIPISSTTTRATCTMVPP